MTHKILKLVAEETHIYWNCLGQYRQSAEHRVIKVNLG